MNRTPVNNINFLRLFISGLLRFDPGLIEYMSKAKDATVKKQVSAEVSFSVLCY